MPPVLFFKFCSLQEIALISTEHFLKFNKKFFPKLSDIVQFIINQ